MYTPHTQSIISASQLLSLSLSHQRENPLILELQSFDLKSLSFQYRAFHFQQITLISGNCLLPFWLQISIKTLYFRIYYTTSFHHFVFLQYCAPFTISYHKKTLSFLFIKRHLLQLSLFKDFSIQFPNLSHFVTPYNFLIHC